MPKSGSPWLYFALTIASGVLFGFGNDLEVATLAIPAFLAVVGFGTVAAIRTFMTLPGAPDQGDADG